MLVSLRFRIRKLLQKLLRYINMNQEKNDKHEKLTFEDIKSIIRFVIVHSLLLGMAIYGIISLITLNSNAAAAYDEQVTETDIIVPVVSGIAIIEYDVGDTLVIYNPISASMTVKALIDLPDGSSSTIFESSTLGSSMTVELLNLPCEIWVSWTNTAEMPSTITYDITRSKTLEEAYNEGVNVGSGQDKCKWPSDKPSTWNFEYNKGFNRASSSFEYVGFDAEYYACGYADAVTNYKNRQYCCFGGSTYYYDGYKYGLTVLGQRSAFGMVNEYLMQFGPKYDDSFTYNTTLDTAKSNIDKLETLATLAGGDGADNAIMYQNGYDHGYSEGQEAGYTEGFNEGSGRDECDRYIEGDEYQKPQGWQIEYEYALRYGEDYMQLANGPLEFYAQGYADAKTDSGNHRTCCCENSTWYDVGYYDAATEQRELQVVDEIYSHVIESARVYDIVVQPAYPATKSLLMQTLDSTFSLVDGSEAKYQAGYQSALYEADEAIGEGYDAAIQKQSMMEKITTYKQLLDQRLYDVYFEQGYQEGLEYGSDLNESVNILAKETSNTLLTILNTEVYGHTLLSMLVGIVLCIIVYVVIKIVGKVR